MRDLSGAGHIARIRPLKKDFPTIDLYTAASIDDTGSDLSMDRYFEKLLSAYKGAVKESEEKTTMGGSDAKRAVVLVGDKRVSLTLAIHWQRPYWVVATSAAGEYRAFEPDIAKTQASVAFMPLSTEKADLIKREGTPYGEIAGLAKVTCSASTEDWTGDAQDDGIGLRLQFNDASGKALPAFYNTRYAVQISLTRKANGEIAFAGTRHGIRQDDFLMGKAVPEPARIPSGSVKGGFDPKLDRGAFDLSVKVVTERQGSFDAILEGPISYSVIRGSSTGLRDLKAGGVDIKPALAESVFEYSVGVPNETATLTLAPATADPKAKVASATLDGAPLAADAKSGFAIPLSVGIPRSLSLTVQAENGRTATYAFAIKRLPSSDARLGSLSFSEGGLSQAFQPGIASYELSVNRAIQKVAMAAAAAHGAATLSYRLDGKSWTPIPQGSAGVEVALAAEKSALEIQVVAQDGTAKVYAINVVKRNEWVLRGKITVPDASYWDALRVGAVYSKSDPADPAYYESLSVLNAVQVKGAYARTTTLRFRDKTQGRPLEIPVALGAIDGKDPRTRDFKVTVSLDGVKSVNERIFIVAWLDSDKDGKWDVVSGSDPSAPFGSLKSWLPMTGSEFNQTPVIVDFKDGKDLRQDIGLSGIKYFPDRQIYGIDFSSVNSNWSGSDNTLRSLKIIESLRIEFTTNAYATLGPQG